MTHILKGSYDVERGDELKDDLLVLLNSGDLKLQLDLKDLEFIDVSCLQVLVAFIKEARARCITLIVSKPSDDVLQFFFMCGVVKSPSYFENSDLMDVLVV